MYSLSQLWITVVLSSLHLLAGVARGQQRCHVCVPGPGIGVSHSEVERLFPGAPLTPCHHGTEQRLCPPDYRGCLTQTKGDEVMRTCAQIALHGCRSANGVEYCYCVGDLCNEPPPPPPPSDDEDLTEASGLGPDTRQSTGHSEERQDTSTPSASVRPSINTTAVTVSAASCMQLTPWLVLTVVHLVAVWR